MKRRSIGGFVTGLIGVITGVPIGIYLFYVILIVAAFASIGSNSTLMTGFLPVSIWFLPLAEIFAIVGVCFYFNKARVGGVLMLIAAILYALPIILFITILEDGFHATFLLVLGFAPAILFLIAAILGLCARSKTKISPEIVAPTIPTNNGNKAHFCSYCGAVLPEGQSKCNNCNAEN